MIAIPNMGMPETCDMCPIEGCEYINRKFTCPLIDIVTCGECKYSDIIESTGQTECLARRGYWFIVDPTGFCSDGKRRT